MGRQVIMKNGEPVAFPVFRWYELTRDETGWELGIFCFLVALTEDFNFSSFRGVITLGIQHGGPFIEFCPGIIPRRFFPLGKEK
jgi:hypothetical protein